MGKSTLLDALRAALFEKYSSKAQPILALQNDRNHAAPVVELAFEAGGALYTVSKRFIRKEYARLSCPDGRLLEGDAAEDELRRLLNFDEPARNGAKAETLGMWNVLWVQQGQSFGAIELPESARASIHGALESQVGSVLGGRRGVALPQTIGNQLGELVAANGKPRGKYKSLLNDIASSQHDLEELHTRRQGLSEDFDRLAKAKEDLERLSASARDEALRAELSDARKRHTELVELEAEIKAANSALELRKRAVDAAAEAQEERRCLRENIAAEDAALKAHKERLEAANHELKERALARSAIQSLVREAEEALKKAEDSVARSERILAAARRDAEIRELQTHYEMAEAAARRLSEAQQAASSILVTDEAMTQIHRADKELYAVAARLTAAATLITFDIPADCLAGIEIDGEQLVEGRCTFSAIEASTITIPGRGRITIEPAIRDREKLLRQQREAKRKLQEQLTRASAANVSDAGAQNEKRQKFLQAAELARQEVELHAPASHDRGAGVQPLADFIEGMRQILARELSELNLTELPAPHNADAALRAAQAAAAAARRTLEVQRAKLSGEEERFGQLQAEFRIACARYDDGRERGEKLRLALETAIEMESDQQLEEKIKRARINLSAQEGLMSNLQAQRRGESVLQVAARVERLEQVIEERKDRRGNLEREMTGLSSRIEALEADGIDEKIAQNQRELELLEKERARLEREVKVLTLLLTTLRTAEQEAKERYLEPVVKRVQPYLGYLFPGADVAIDDNFHVTGVTRQSGYDEDFHRLSMGTQEQIAVLVRLAFAEMLVEHGRPAAVILDDALVFSDDPRMSRMFDILKMAARKVQVIVLSCREQLFEELGGRQLTLQAGKADELMSA
jgi:DNA repair exonuclease SbcCD ATPase subunit